MTQAARNKRRFYTLVALVVLTGLVYWFTNRERHIRIDKKLFQVEDYNRIDRITLAGPKGTVSLHYNGARWKVNDRYDADRNLVDVLFATLLRAEPKRPLEAPAHMAELVSRLKKSSVNVTLYEKETPVKTFFAGRYSNTNESYFIDPATEQAYVMVIPGYRVYVSDILDMSENQWRDKHAFGFNWQNFKGLGVSFPENPVENFTVSLRGNVFGINELAATDTAKLNTFLDNVSLLTVAEYLEPGTVTDSLKQRKPAMVITIMDVRDRIYELKLFGERKGEVAGLLQGDQGVLFARQRIRPVVRPKSFFKKTK